MGTLGVGLILRCNSDGGGFPLTIELKTVVPK